MYIQRLERQAKFQTNRFYRLEMVTMKFLRPLISTLFLVIACEANADILTPPTQNEWVSAKKYIQVNDAVKIAYVEWGDPDGEPVILIHGYSDTSRAYSTIAPYLTSKRYLAVDLRGHGDSSEPECCYYISDFAEDISDFIVAMGYEKAIVVGHSLGSMTAGVLASMHPNQVSKLVLISSALKPGPGTYFLYDMLHAQEFPLDVNGEFMQMWAPDSSANNPEMMALLRKEEAAMPERAWLGIIKGLEILDWTTAASRITAPTLIMWGDQDEMMIESDQDALRKALPDAQFIRYDGLGHSMYWEDPERSAEDLIEFLD